MAEELNGKENVETQNSDGQTGDLPEKKNGDSFSKRHSKIIAYSALGSFLVTAVLATLTGLSLKEVKQQRELSYRQFVMANRPNIEIFVSKDGLILNDNASYVDWSVKNSGGDIEDVSYLCTLFDVKETREKGVTIEGFYEFNTSRKNQNKGTTLSLKSPIEVEENLKRIKNIKSGDKTKNVLLLYLKADYKIPAELTIDKISRKDSRFNLHVWSEDHNRFEDLSITLFDLLVKKIGEEKLKGTNSPN